MRRAVVVAHPDDEAIWFGGLVAANPGNWTIICCSIPRVDPIRAWKFFAACEVLGATGKLLPFTEAEPSQRLPYLDATLDLSEFDLIVTHGPAAEYGHVHHRQIHDFVVDKYNSTQLLLCGFGSDDSLCSSLDLTEAQFRTKIDALGKYDHKLPYGNRVISKSEAIIERYFSGSEDGLRREKYLGANASKAMFDLW